MAVRLSATPNSVTRKKVARQLAFYFLFLSRDAVAIDLRFFKLKVARWMKFAVHALLSARPDGTKWVISGALHTRRNWVTKKKMSLHLNEHAERLLGLRSRCTWRRLCHTPKRVLRRTNYRSTQGVLQLAGMCSATTSSFQMQVDLHISAYI